jgi:hypothetical protein
MEGAATMKRTLIAVTLAMLAASAGVSAQIYNPDNDSQTFFANNVPPIASTQAPTGVTPVGTVSPDGRYVYVGGEREWENRQHSYQIVPARGVIHTADCLPMDEPKPQLTAADFEAMRLAERTSDR